MTQQFSLYLLFWNLVCASFEATLPDLVYKRNKHERQPMFVSISLIYMHESHYFWNDGRQACTQTASTMTYIHETRARRPRCHAATHLVGE